MDHGDRTVPGDVRTHARELAVDYPQLAWFTAQVVDEIDRLRTRLDDVELALAAHQADAVDSHASDLLDLHARLDAVAALCDLAEWAEDADPTGRRPSVLVEDIRVALQRQR